MAAAVLFPSAIDVIRAINDNAIDNLLAAQPSYAQLPSLYQRAYWLVHETGPINVDANVEAPEVQPGDPRIPRLIDPLTGAV